jgi:histidine triad (HIT) family protein
MVECPFCAIIAGKIPAFKVWEDNNNLAFLDINPRNPGHTLVVPKKHVETILNLSEEEAANFFIAVHKVAKMVKAGIKADGISLSLSSGQAAGQLVPHIHFHIIPRFLNEGPVGLESILPTKKMAKEDMERVVAAIKGGPEKTKAKKIEEESFEDFEEL